MLFESKPPSTIDVVGAQHVVLHITGFSSMRITSSLAVREVVLGLCLPKFLKGREKMLVCSQAAILLGSRMPGLILNNSAYGLIRFCPE